MAATAPLTPIAARDEDAALSQYRDAEAIAAAVAWDLLVHDPAFGPDMARVAPMPNPDGLYAEIVLDFLWDIVTEAARLGHRMARLDLSAFDLQKVSPADVSRALAALLHRPTVEDGQAFDPDYLTKRDAAERAA